MRSTELEQVVSETTRGLTLERRDRVLGIWEIYLGLRGRWELWDRPGITEAAEDVLARLVADGAKLASLDHDMRRFLPWPDQHGAVQEVSRQLRAIGCDPVAGQIGWLLRPTSTEPQPTLDPPAFPTLTGPRRSREEATLATSLLMNELKDDVFGPWFIFKKLDVVSKGLTLAESWDLADAVIKEMVTERCAVIGDYDARSHRLLPWDDQEGAVDRVTQEWRSLTRRPLPGEICWIGPPVPEDISAGTAAPEVAEVIERLHQSFGHHHICAWHIFWHLRHLRQEWTRQEISGAAQDVLRSLSTEGALLGSVTRPTPNVRPWPAHEDMARFIANIWRSMDRDPEPGEIGYLDVPPNPPGRIATERLPRAPLAWPPGTDTVIVAVVEELRTELDDDVVGPWEIFASLRSQRASWDQEEIWRAAEEALALLLSNGAVFGDLVRLAEDFQPWPDQSAALAQVVEEWERLGRDPGFGEICWLELPDRSGGL